jgi:hypothetical protein
VAQSIGAEATSTKLSIKGGPSEAKVQSRDFYRCDEDTPFRSGGKAAAAV